MFTTATCQESQGLRQLSCPYSAHSNLEAGRKSPHEEGHEDP